MYAGFLGSRINRDGSFYCYPKPVMENDFVNDCLSKYMVSLQGYQVVPESIKICSSEFGERLESNFFIEYLNVKNLRGMILGFQDVGSGISYLMPILASLWASPFSIVEQPELHLHPRAQCELGDVFISAYKNGSSALVESHSEHLLLRLLRRIRETNNNYLIPSELRFTPEELFIYYFDPQPDGQTVVKRIRIDKYGELMDLWPGGFFSERDRELFS
jgi:predicted ATPase